VIPPAPARSAPLAEQYAVFRAWGEAGRALDYEGLLRRFHGALLKPGDVALDLGAFEGTHAIPMARAVGPAGAVHAFEPNPAMAAGLRARFAAPEFAQVTLHEAAVGLEDGEADYVLALDSPGYSGLRERTYDQPGMTTRAIRVRTVRLDTVFAALDRLVFLKADLEGGEFHALLGGAALVARTRPAIAFEFGAKSYGAYGVDPGEVFDWFAGLGYVLFDIVGNVLLERDRFLRADAIPGLWDYLAVAAERADWRVLARDQHAAIGDFLRG
jgi:FkbM family methyltransferase